MSVAGEPILVDYLRMMCLAVAGEDGLIVNAVTDDSDSEDDAPVPYTGTSVWFRGRGGCFADMLSS